MSWLFVLSLFILGISTYLSPNHPKARAVAFGSASLVWLFIVLAVVKVLP